MSEPIKVGDLVVVIRGPYCCNSPERLGIHFTVKSIFTEQDATVICRYCRATRNGGSLVASTGLGYGIYLSRLKRIPPLAELETQRQTEETTV